MSGLRAIINGRRIMKKSNKYSYIQGTQITDQGSRIYEVNGMRAPSVTTILAKTKDQEYLTAWKNKVRSS